MVLKNLSKCSVLVFGLVAVLGVQSAEASDKRFIFEQAEVALPLVLDGPTGRPLIQRLRISALTETVSLGSNRKISLAANDDVPAYLESGMQEQDMRVVLTAVDAKAEVTGRVYFMRNLLLLDAAGELRAELRVKMELDLLGLGAERPQLKLRQAELLSVSGHGKWQGYTLARPVYLALPSAPLSWSMSDAHLAYDHKSHRLHGAWKLALPLSPAAFLDGDVARIQVTLYAKNGTFRQSLQILVGAETNSAGERIWRQQASSSQIHDFTIRWEKSNKTYIGRITGTINSRKEDALHRISVRVGSKASPFNAQMIGLVAQR